MNGLILNRPASLSEILAPIAKDLERYFWLIDIQCGPFRSDWISHPVNDAWVDDHLWEVERFECTSACGFRPGLLPRFADEFILDEWSYYFAIDTDEQSALVKAGRLNGKQGYISSIKELSRVAAMFAMHVDGWWEIYCDRDDWRSRLKIMLPDLRERSIEMAGQLPCW